MTTQQELHSTDNDHQWENVVFSDVIEINNYPSAEKEEEYKSIGMSDVEKNVRKIQSWEVKEYSYSRPRFKNGQTIMARITPCLENGKTAFVDVLDDDEVAIGSTEFIVLSETEDIIPKFVYYTARRPEIRKFAIKRMTGTSGRQRVPLDIFDNKEITIPPINEQRKIVEILDSLDSKIEVNSRVNEILEDIIQNIFKSWFINFDIYRNFKDSELGEIPETFEIVQIKDICEEIKNGGTPERSNSDYWEGNIPWIKTGELNGNVISDTEEKITKEGFESNNCSLVDENTVLVALYGASVGNTGLTKIPATFNQACCSLQAKSDVGFGFLFQSLKHLKSKFKQLSRGSAQQNISQGIIKEQKIALPPSEDLEKFKECVHPFYEKMGANKEQSINLSEIRDTLLPKLMSGEIRVNDINLEDLEVGNEV